MHRLVIILLILIIIPTLGYGQLKKDAEKPNISESLVAYNPNDVLVGFLDPSRFQMSHSFSMSYMGFGGGGAMINTYVNTLNYRFSDDLFLTTKLGMNVRIPVKDIRSQGRNTMGVRIMRLNEGDKVVSVTKIIEEDDDFEEGEETEEIKESEEKHEAEETDNSEEFAEN